MGKVYMSSKVVKVRGWGESEYSVCVGEIYWELCTVLCDRGVVCRLYRLCCEVSCVYCCLLSCV